MKLFHQNMMVFGGNAPLRVGSFNGQFALLEAGLSRAQPIAVAGFTEVTNRGAARTVLANPLAPTLELELLTVARVGRMALGAGEFCGIAVRAGVLVRSVGRVFIVNENENFLDVSPQIPPSAAWADDIPGGISLDYRGLLYVVVEVGRRVLAVGFLHNTYVNDATRFTVAQRIPWLGATMLSDPAAHAGALVAPGYIGGDFNVEPIDRLNWRAYARGAADPAGTTSFGHLYDYWYSTVHPGEHPALLDNGNEGPLMATPVPEVFAGTRAASISDHCGVLLQVT